MTFTQDTAQALIYFGVAVGLVSIGIWRAIKAFGKHVTKPIVTSMSEIKDAVVIQREAYTDALKVKDQRYDDLKRQADDSIANREEMRQEIEAIQGKQRQRDLVFNEFKSTFDGLEKALREKNADLVIANQTITYLNAQLTEAGKLKEEVGNLRNRVDTLEKEVGKMAQREQELITENSELKKQLTQKDELLAERDKRIKALEDELLALKATTPTDTVATVADVQSHRA